MRPLHRFTVLPTVPDALNPLRVLAHNLRWSWHPATQGLFRDIDPAGWEASGHNPLRMLNEIDAPVLEQAADDPDFLARQQALLEDLQAYLNEPRWYQTLANAPSRIAYFSPEFGVSEVLPQYSGGLGVLAGDHLKAASDLGVPVVGVGLFYRSGYFRQSLTADGRQQESYPAFNPHELPFELVRDGGGTPRSGGPRSAGRRCCCSTPTSTRTARPSGRSPTVCTAAAASTACARRSCSASAGSGPCTPSGSSPRCSTPTRATPGSSAWSGSAA